MAIPGIQGSPSFQTSIASAARSGASSSQDVMFETGSFNAGSDSPMKSLILIGGIIAVALILSRKK